MDSKKTGYFAQETVPSNSADYARALERVVARKRALIPIAGLRNPRIGTPDAGTSWIWCQGYDWVMGFFSCQLWLCHQLTGDPVFAGAARARRSQFRRVLADRRSQDHDIGFLFSLHAVADWRATGDPAARDMALSAAHILLGRFRE
jgi:unsaturated chondroitin disaccharide hydrolase